MTGIFYTDYASDAERAVKIEKLFSPAHDSGIEICRTSLMPQPSAYATLPLPAFLRRAVNQALRKLRDDEEDLDLLRYAGEALRLSRPAVSADLAARMMGFYRDYMYTQLDEMQPDLAVIWHQFTSYHYLIANWCMKKNVPVIYCENGVLPLSWCFEYGGQMGESWITNRPDQFAALSITTSDRDRATAYLDQAVTNRLNRKGAGKPVAETDLADRLAANHKPVLLYAGINDEKTGVKPYLMSRTPLHSPGYTDTGDGLDALVEVAEANDWLVLYKQHPSRLGKEKAKPDSDHLITVDGELDLIDLMSVSDVVVTLVSQTAYMALIHGKPCVLMGRMQLTGSGLVHEALERQHLANSVKDAMIEGFGKDKRDILRDHVARLLKYYVVYYDFESSDVFHYNLNDVAQSMKTLGTRVE